MAITGVIRPPPEIRAVADRTALYVAKNGRAFEARILKSEKAKTPKFAFLQPTSPFHAYYEDRIQFYEAGGEDGDDADTNNKKEVAEKKEQEKTAPKETTVRKTEKTQKASAIDPIAKALLGQRNKIQQARAKQKEESKEGKDGSPETQPFPLPPPPPLELVTIVAPSNLSVVQIETIQLVAQFAAMDGKGGPFLQQLTLREWTNSAFSFCQPRHAHFAYFSALVDAYRRILGQWTASANSKSMTSGTPLDAQASLQQAAYRAEYERELLQMKSQQEEGEVVAIDWQDFVVVETIDFPVDEKVELSMLPPPPPPPKMQEQPSVAAKTEQEGMEESDEEDEEETIRVVPSYTPNVVGTANPLQARAIDPITGKSVSVADMPEHMRIQLMDPKWAEERKKFQEKQKDSNLVTGDAIASNISRFAQARGDLFGKSVSLVSSKVTRLF
jgi:splicing factor 3A subunit 1